MASNISKILCCNCGVLTVPTVSNRCEDCYRLEGRASQHIRRLVNVAYCRFCERYLNPPSAWLHFKRDTKEFLAHLLKRIPGIKKVDLINAEFIPTEEHTFEVKIRIDVREKGSNDSPLETCDITYNLNKQMCTACHRVEAQDFWKAIVQVRQHVPLKRTFFKLEEIILQKNALLQCTGIKKQTGGLDFLFQSKQDARKFTHFVSENAPLKLITSEQLISHDTHSNSYYYKNAFSLELVPACKDDVVCISKAVMKSFGLQNQLLIVTKITKLLHLIDPLTLDHIEINSNTYWSREMNVVCTTRNLKKFTVLDVEIIDNKMYNKFVLADVTLMPESNIYDNKIIHVKSHIGKFLHAGDTVEAFYVIESNVNDDNFDKIPKTELYDALVVRKFVERNARRKRVGSSKACSEYTDIDREDEDDRFKDLYI